MAAVVPVSAQEPAKPAILHALSPAQGPVGTLVTVTGEPFAASDNVVKFGRGYVKGLWANGSITFTVPSFLDLCPPGQICGVAPLFKVTPSTYMVSVLTDAGVSNSLAFKVTSQAADRPPYLEYFTASSRNPMAGDKLTFKYRACDREGKVSVATCAGYPGETFGCSGGGGGPDTKPKLPDCQEGSFTHVFEKAGSAFARVMASDANGQKAERTINITVRQASCSDSDRGQDYYKKGTVKLGSGYQETDFCLISQETGTESGVLAEFSCYEKGGASRVDFKCPYGCNNGACLKQAAAPQYKSAEWQCHDGMQVSIIEGDGICKSSAEWDKQARQSCNNRCYKKTGKCGVNTFAVLQPCENLPGEANGTFTGSGSSGTGDGLTGKAAAIDSVAADMELTAIVPAVGYVGTAVTLTGTGFDDADNTVKFGPGYLAGIDLDNESRLKFTVPQQIDTCLPGNGCDPDLAAILPGKYNVSVLSSNGVSNALQFTVKQMQNKPPVINMLAMATQLPLAGQKIDFTYKAC
ncbi:MAG: IPT/TIG domain-containing protein, partial [Candidatus Aenigmarchaeota archaeon]|nr:IPT/TIG domain-containing protein [Candidatus Aenigmarchaeota archaeon]